MEDGSIVLITYSNIIKRNPLQSVNIHDTQNWTVQQEADLFNHDSMTAKLQLVKKEKTQVHHLLD